MIVAVIVVRMVKAPVDEIVDVITMRHRLVSARVSMRVAGRAAGRHGVTVRVSGVHCDYVLIDVIAVWVVQVALVEIVDVIFVADRDVAAALLVDMRVVALVNGVRHTRTVPAVLDRRQAGNDKTYSQTRTLVQRAGGSGRWFRRYRTCDQSATASVQGRTKGLHGGPLHSGRLPCLFQ